MPISFPLVGDVPEGLAFLPHPDTNVTAISVTARNRIVFNFVLQVMIGPTAKLLLFEHFLDSETLRSACAGRAEIVSITGSLCKARAIPLVVCCGGRDQDQISSRVRRDDSAPIVVTEIAANYENDGSGHFYPPAVDDADSKVGKSDALSREFTSPIHRFTMAFIPCLTS